MADKSHSTDRYADFTTDRRVLLLSLMAFVIGAVSTLVTVALLWLIDAFTNLAYFNRLSAVHVVPANNHLWSFGGSGTDGRRANHRYNGNGTAHSKIWGHGIPEAIEAIPIGRSKIELRRLRY